MVSFQVECRWRLLPPYPPSRGELGRPVRVPVGPSHGSRLPAVERRAACVVPPAGASSQRALPDAGAHQPSFGGLLLRRTTFLLLPVRMSAVGEPSAHRLPCVAPKLYQPSYLDRVYSGCGLVRLRARSGRSRFSCLPMDDPQSGPNIIPINFPNNRTTRSG